MNEPHLGFNVEPEQRWATCERPEKAKSRLQILMDIKRRQTRPFDFAFELPGRDFIFTPVLSDLCVGTTRQERLNRIFGAEDNDEEYKLMRVTKPLNYGWLGHHNTAIAFDIIDRRDSKVKFDFVWLDYCGYWCDEKELAIHRLFTNKQMNTGRETLFYITLGDIRTNPRTDAAMRAFFLQQGISDLKTDNLFEASKYAIMKIAADRFYGLTPVFDYRYQDDHEGAKNTAKMYVFGFTCLYLGDPWSADRFLRAQAAFLDERYILQESAHQR